MSAKSDLRAAGKKLRKADDTHKKAMEDVMESIVDAYISGLGITEIHRLSGVSRQTVYTVLKNKGVF